MNKKKLSGVVFTLLLAIALTATLTGCMNITMRKANVIKRLEKADYNISYISSTPMVNVENGKNKVDEIIKAEKTREDGTFTVVFIYFCTNDDAADWVENQSKSYTDNNVRKPSYYRYDLIVMWGDYDSITVARNY